ncbi:hypothetical protein GCM10010169_41720 [Micromonospora fulviviridis]|nr:hypothetical protein GCM10010169_41720 [Micromonospora fulviviridis]
MGAVPRLGRLNQRRKGGPPSGGPPFRRYGPPGYGPPPAVPGAGHPQGSADGATFTTLAAPAGVRFDPASGNTATVAVPTTTVRHVRVTVAGNTAWPAANSRRSRRTRPPARPPRRPPRAPWR